jgi:hypothetical protein
MPHGLPAATVTTRGDSWPLLQGVGQLWVPNASKVEILYPAACQDGWNKFERQVVCRFNETEVVVKISALRL